MYALLKNRVAAVALSTTLLSLPAFGGEEAERFGQVQVGAVCGCLDQPRARRGPSGAGGFGGTTGASVDGSGVGAATGCGKGWGTGRGLGFGGVGVAT